jgi:hypothetical protein
MLSATLGISLYGNNYLKLAKTICLSYYLYVFSSTKLEKKRVEQVLPRSGVCVWGGGTQNVYTGK